MKFIVTIFCLLICSSPAYSAGSLAQTTEKGMFGLEITLKGKELKTGTNSLVILVRDKQGKGVDGAELTIAPWMTAMGHGVWEKPVVTGRKGGEYHVENLRITGSGRWDLKVAVKKGTQEDRAIFPFTITEKVQPSPGKLEKTTGNYERSVKYYNIPNVTLLNQDGKKVNIRALMDSGKPVIVDFIFTTCTTICPVLSAGFSNLRKELGANADNVQFISISIDPEHDRPQQMKEYLARFRGGKSWEFLTGSREDITKVLRALDAFIVDKMFHEPLHILRGPNSDEWVRIKGLISKSDLMAELRRIENK